jgi:hypothetical protein
MFVQAATGGVMALLAESLVQEWLNRGGFFTIRGVKHGQGEMDLLAVRPQPEGVVIGRHVEVQVSFQPVGYVAKLADELAKEMGKKRTSSVARSTEQITVCAQKWVENKFKTPAKVKLRERLWPGVQWEYHLVHAKVHEPRELEVFTAEGVACLSFNLLLSELCGKSNCCFSSSAGGDLAEILKYYGVNGPK